MTSWLPNIATILILCSFSFFKPLRNSSIVSALSCALSKVSPQFKTKSTTIGAVGTYKLKGVSEEHRVQAIAYSILFGVDECIFTYESVAKDGWTKGEEAKIDLRTFYIKITEEDRKELLDRLSEIAKQYYNNEIPAKEDKCFFCVYKNACERVGN